MFTDLYYMKKDDIQFSRRKFIQVLPACGAMLSLSRIGTGQVLSGQNQSDVHSLLPKIPYPKSDLIKGIRWLTEPVKSGWSGDTWSCTWAKDGNIYTVGDDTTGNTPAPQDMSSWVTDREFVIPFPKSFLKDLLFRVCSLNIHPMIIGIPLKIVPSSSSCGWMKLNVDETDLPCSPGFSL